MKDTENGVRAVFFCDNVRVLDVWTRFPPVVGDELRCFGKIYKIVHRLFAYEDFQSYHFAYTMALVDENE